MPFINTPDGLIVVTDYGTLWNFNPSDPHNPFMPLLPSQIDLVLRQGPVQGGGAGPAFPVGGELPPAAGAGSSDSFDAFVRKLFGGAGTTTPQQQQQQGKAAAGALVIGAVLLLLLLK